MYVVEHALLNLGKNKSVIIVTHSENVTVIADEVIGIRAGQLLSGKEYQAMIKEVAEDE
jgi:ABC-type lipoprotein export system ATPase subunit